MGFSEGQNGSGGNIGWYITKNGVIHRISTSFQQAATNGGCRSIPIGDNRRRKIFTSRCDDFFQHTYQLREVDRDDLPENIEIECIVAMDQPIAQTNDLLQGNRGILLSDLRRDAVGCFSDDFQEPHQREVQEAIRVEISARSLPCQGNRLFRVIEHVTEAQGNVTSGHRASRPPPPPGFGSRGSETAAC